MALTIGLEIDKTGYQEPLRYPAFRQELLYESGWEPGEVLGRIQVVISEGLLRERSSPHTNPMQSFIRIRDVVTFSFHHAPLGKIVFARGLFSLVDTNKWMWHDQIFFGSTALHGRISSCSRKLSTVN
jgi:hypothetical protein